MLTPVQQVLPARRIQCSSSWRATRKPSHNLTRISCLRLSAVNETGFRPFSTYLQWSRYPGCGPRSQRWRSSCHFCLSVDGVPRLWLSRKVSSSLRYEGLASTPNCYKITAVTLSLCQFFGIHICLGMLAILCHKSMSNGRKLCPPSALAARSGVQNKPCM